MTQIILTDELRALFKDFQGRLDIVDTSGKRVARVIPTVDPADYEPWVPEFDEAELCRREKSDKWYSTKQVLEHLKNLENQ